MNTKGDENRSVRQTKRRLNEALLKLMADKPARQITVRELTTLAEVSRGTFYFHYADIYDLLDQLEQEQLTALRAVCSGVLEGLESEAPPAALVALFRFLEENELLSRALLGPHGDPAFVAELKKTIEHQCIGHLAEPGQENQSQAYLTGFAVNGCVGSIEAWLLGGRVQPAEKMAELTWKAIRAIRGVARPQANEK